MKTPTADPAKAADDSIRNTLSVTLGRCRDNHNPIGVSGELRDLHNHRPYGLAIDCKLEGFLDLLGEVA